MCYTSITKNNLYIYSMVLIILALLTLQELKALFFVNLTLWSICGTLMSRNEGKIMKQEMYVIATRGKNNKEVYLKATEKETRIKGDKAHIKILCEWTENIDEAIATFAYTDSENMAKNYFIKYDKWYIKPYKASFC